MPLKYIGTCARCGVALYREGNEMFAAAKTSCKHVPSGPMHKMIKRWIGLHPDEDLFLNQQTKKLRISRGQYIRAFLLSEMKKEEQNGKV